MTGRDSQRKISHERNENTRPTREERERERGSETENAFGTYAQCAQRAGSMRPVV